MAPPSTEYGTFELLYELPMSAVSGGVGRGAGVGRGREVGRGPLFAVSAPMARMRTANAALINLVIVFICFLLSSFFCGICRPKFGNFFRNRKKVLVRREIVWGRSRSTQFNKPPPPHKH